MILAATGENELSTRPRSLMELRPARGAARIAAHSPISDVGNKLSDDSLTMSPDMPAARRVGSLKRDSRMRIGSTKRLATSASPNKLVRKGSLSPMVYDSA